MKKIILIVGITILLIGIQTTTAIPITKNKNSILETIEDEEIPSWAIGTFNGTWAYDFLGLGEIPWPPLGNITGYYGAGYNLYTKLGRFLVDFKYFDGTNAAKLEGLFFGPYLIGRVWRIDDEYNASAFVGIGHYNETSSEFVWRIMRFSGPTFFMWGTSAKFE